MKYIIVFLFIFIIVSLCFYLFGYVLPKKRHTLGKNKAFRYIVKKNDFNMNEERTKTLSKMIAIANSLILSSTLTIMASIVTSIIVKMIISFVIFIIEFLLVYNLIGYILKKKGW